MLVSDFDYKLPESLIAQFPPKERGASRLLVLKRQGQPLVEHRAYADLVDYLEPGDVVVLNDTKVIKARLLATNSSGQTRELLLVEGHHNTDFTRRKALYRGKIRAGELLNVGDISVKVEMLLGGGLAEISSTVSLLELAEQSGSVPLPPYMHRDASRQDTERYQTVFAKHPGSVAAPTASLNFTDELKATLLAKGINIAYLTLHVGLGTFLPIRTDNLEGHQMHSEYFEIPKQTVETLKNTHANGGKVVAVGTTVARTLEFTADQILANPSQALSGEADIFIYPGYKFRLVDCLLTNFHAPKTTVLMLAAAFAGWDNLKRAYDEAVGQRYAFLSYGDSMLIV